MLPAMSERNEIDRGTRALVEGCGLVERPNVEALEVTGEDRLRFLNGLVTCDVAGLEPGQGVYGFFTGVKGKILADVTVLALDDRLWLELPPGRAGEVKAHCEKYRIVDRVDFAPLARTATTLLGPEAEAILGDGVALPEAALSHAAGVAHGVEVRAVREVRFGGAGVSLWTSPDDTEGLVAALRAAGATAVACEVLDAWRIERGWPVCGVDYAFGSEGGGEHFPQETGLGDLAVSYTKGCYLGQEIVARIHYRGGVNRHLRGLRLEKVPGTSEKVPGTTTGEVPGASEEVPGTPESEKVPGTLEKVPGTELTIEGRGVGRLTSVARSPRFGVIGLAVLHRRGAEPGTRLDLADDAGTAEVVELPFDPP